MPPDPEQELLRQNAATAAAYFVQVTSVASVLYNNPGYYSQPYHTSALSGIAWVNELIHGHPNRILCELGMHLHVFQAFCSSLILYGGLVTSRNGVTVEEQAAIFLYTCVTGLSICHVGERFQRSNDTISK